MTSDEDLAQADHLSRAEARRARLGPEAVAAAEACALSAPPISPEACRALDALLGMPDATIAENAPALAEKAAS
jgi:hypothetical protein